MIWIWIISFAIVLAIGKIEIEGNIIGFIIAMAMIFALSPALALSALIHHIKV